MSVKVFSVESPVFSHVLILKAGKVLASGRKAEHLTSTVLSKTFETQMRLRKIRGKYALAVAARPRVVV